jgi:hypothetical protein
MQPAPDDPTTRNPVPRPPGRTPPAPALRPSRRRQRADRRELDRTLRSVDRHRADGVEAELVRLSQRAALVDAIVLVHSRPSLRLLRITFKDHDVALLMAVGSRAIDDLGAIPLPAYITLRAARRRRGSWSLDLSTLDGTTTVTGSELVLADGG